MSTDHLSISWYRTPVPRETMQALLSKSDWAAWWQTGGFLAILLATGSTTVWAAHAHHWLLFSVGFFAHGMGMAFLINAVHELGHQTVFRWRGLNRFFCPFFAFFGWINHLMFSESHARHHRYTLHQPYDLEVTLPSQPRWRDFFRSGFVQVDLPLNLLRFVRSAVSGQLFMGEWQERCYPAAATEPRRAAVRWARTIVGGHLLIGTVACWYGWWAIPLVVSLHGLTGQWLFWLCNNTQHCGLQDEVNDARLCCRSFTINRLVGFLYWHMNFHTEHHMFAAVPCYRLGQLHRAIVHDLPPTPHGLIATWREIMAIGRRQRADATYCLRACPPRAVVDPAAPAPAADHVPDLLDMGCPPTSVNW